MVPYRLFFLIILAVAAAGVIYVICRFHKLGFVHAVAKKNRLLAWLLCLTPVAACAGFLAVNVYGFVIALVHLIVIWLLCDFVALIARLIRGQKSKRYYAGWAALIGTALVLAMGWFCAHHVFITRYAFTTAKDLGRERLRVAVVADSHLGVTQFGDTFAREMQRLATEDPDLMVVVGDFVDDDTPRKDMLAASDALGALKMPVYFVYGNHDKGYFSYRNFSTSELRAALERNNVIILEDETALIEDSFYIIGRQDRSARGRLPMSTLTAGLDASKYMIVLDHQPNDYANEAAAGVDLVLSGHTHGGHIWPAGQIGLMMGANDRRYGTEQRGGTTFVVTSGISGWAIPFKTGTISETVIIDITQSHE